ncbi:GNAT family N-acetyltransferase [Actinomadura barringtoniae]|uniref:GNAT family N-acetyltransferase n=1 Tax=Actinomadura barringtoniae TaxID=1427535 RepID=A0A939PDU7_9ACTN|nr:GNAT family N-acetyltransferase [Actinomadura barringtoniae]MBO2446671.1 GNAT family N-acetyltransferase [Actinomadura barringtoniae]
MTLIRTAGVADTEAIEQVRSRSWRAAYAGLIPQVLIDAATGPEALERRRASFTEHPEVHTLLASTDAGDPIGMAAYGPERDLPTSPKGVELYSLYVVPEHWSAKVGRALMDRVITDTRAAGNDLLVLWVLDTNERARRFYERAGFAPGEPATRTVYGRTIDEVRYARGL